MKEIGAEESPYRRRITMQEFYSVHRDDGNTRVRALVLLAVAKAWSVKDIVRKR